MKRILVLDDDQEFRRVLRKMLDGSFEVLEASVPREAFQVISRFHPDLVILEESHGELCGQLRANPATRAIPVLMLVGGIGEEGADQRWMARVRSLNAGADDVLEQPFYPEELLARVRARLRSRDHEAIDRAEVVVGNLRLDPVTFSCRVGDGSVVLTPTEFELLRYFLERTNRVLARKQLLGDLWPDTVVTRRTIDTHVANLRKKLTGFDHAFETIYGAGYRLTGRES